MAEDQNRARDAEALKEGYRAVKEKKDGIIAASPLVPRSPNTLAHRVVIRDLGDEYVEHTQIYEDDGRWNFHQGYYVPKKDGPEEATAKAWGYFERRSRLILNMPPPADIAQVASIAQEIIESLLPDDRHDRADQIREDYQLESDIDTFEHLTGKTLWDRDAGEGANHVDDDEDESDDDEEDEC